eukprot:CAMPEP_0198526074 /NCGR_PEP_ID=MMETSP1462-20131121/23743_1 /TAXON_ID=1333877 /ORGANISM="Brandtodinium nutriculum, Strain RCC3387" /LENGTH=196 /DNA_ID=CAMNT_0044255839 /DNA_START=27 /DNA_END=614 /DNA_ORIENTATION=+
MALAFYFFVPASGIYAMQAYSADILRFCGVAEPLRILPYVGWAKLAGALATVGTIDLPQVGRRRLACFGSLGCFLAYMLLAWHISSPGLVPTAVATLAFFVFFFAWNAGYGSVQFVAVLEILPNEVRSVWAGQIYALVGIVEILIYQTFESLLLRGGATTFVSFGAVNAFAAAYACVVMSDMRGKSLEQVDGEPGP